MRAFSIPEGLTTARDKFQFQAGIPQDVREHFDKKKKFSLMPNASEEREAERLAAEAQREFKSKVMQIGQANPRTPLLEQSGF